MEASTVDDSDGDQKDLVPDIPDYKPEYIETKYGIADQDLKKLGFLTAVEYPDDPYPRYEELLLNHKMALDNIRSDSMRIADVQKDKYNALLDKGAARHAEIERELNAYGTEVSDQEHERRDLSSKLQQVKDNIYGVYLNLAARKKNFVSERIDEVNADLKKMMDSQSTLFDDKDGYFKGYAATGKQIADQTLERVRKITASFEKRYDEIQLFIQCFDKHGVSAISYSMLVAIGWSAALVAGLFFAAAFDDKGAANLLDDLLQSALILVHSYGHWEGLGMLAGLILVASVIIVSIDYLMRLYKKRLLNKRLDHILPKDKDAFSFATNGNNAFGLNLSIKADSWWYFWLQALPFILLVACGVFLLSYKYDGASGKPVYDLSKTTMGVVIALASAGLLYIVIGRRFRAECVPPDGKEPPAKTWWSKDWELRFLVALLVVWDVVMIALYVLYATRQIEMTNEWKHFISLSEFILVTVMCAVSLSYGLYLRSMTDLATELEEYLHRLHSLHWEYYASVPSLYYANVFGKTFRDLHLQMLMAVGKKVNPYFPIPQHSVDKLRKNLSAMAKAILRNRNDEENQKSALERFWDFVRFWKAKEEKPQDVPIQYNLGEDDKMLFPDLNEHIDTLEKEKQDIEKRMQALDSDISQYKLRKSERYTTLTKQADLLTEQINGWRNAIVEIDQRLLTELKHMRRQRIKEQVILMDGFHLGMWHRENDMGPVKGFFTDKKVSV